MAYTNEELQEIWEKGIIVEKYDSDKYRKDICSAWMIRDEYGNRKSIYGWEVDHIDSDGEDEMKNYQPMQWENNLAKSDGKTEFAVVSAGNKNIRLE